MIEPWKVCSWYNILIAYSFVHLICYCIIQTWKNYSKSLKLWKDNIWKDLWHSWRLYLKGVILTYSNLFKPIFHTHNCTNIYVSVKGWFWCMLYNEVEYWLTKLRLRYIRPFIFKCEIIFQIESVKKWLHTLTIRSSSSSRTSETSEVNESIILSSSSSTNGILKVVK